MGRKFGYGVQYRIREGKTKMLLTRVFVGFKSASNLVSKLQKNPKVLKRSIRLINMDELSDSGRESLVKRSKE